jgi:hypothetical protein
MNEVFFFQKITKDKVCCDSLSCHTGWPSDWF